MKRDTIFGHKCETSLVPHKQLNLFYKSYYRSENWKLSFSLRNIDYDHFLQFNLSRENPHFGLTLILLFYQKSNRELHRDFPQGLLLESVLQLGHPGSVTEASHQE